jgi:hypothetical protein
MPHRTEIGFAKNLIWTSPIVLAPGAFDVVTSARTMRQLQFSLKYLF